MHTVFRFLRQLLLTVLLLALLVLVAAGGYFAVTGHKLYESAIQVTPIDTLYSSISSREGFVPYAQLPQTYINAVISAEDSRFTHHKGVDPVSIARALVTDLRTGSFAEGGSTQRPAPMVIYIVKPEDRLWDIAKKYKSTVETIAEINHLEEESLQPGQKLLILK